MVTLKGRVAITEGLDACGSHRLCHRRHPAAVASPCSNIIISPRLLGQLRGSLSAGWGGNPAKCRRSRSLPGPGFAEPNAKKQRSVCLCCICASMLCSLSSSCLLLLLRHTTGRSCGPIAALPPSFVFHFPGFVSFRTELDR